MKSIIKDINKLKKNVAKIHNRNLILESKLKAINKLFWETPNDQPIDKKKLAKILDEWVK